MPAGWAEETPSWAKLGFDERVAEVADYLAQDADPINHPTHYAAGWSNGAEVIDITENLNFNRGNAVKYVTRAGRKNPETEVEDLYKAAWYIQREIDRLVWA